MLISKPLHSRRRLQGKSTQLIDIADTHARASLLSDGTILSVARTLLVKNRKNWTATRRLAQSTWVFKMESGSITVKMDGEAAADLVSLILVLQYCENFGLVEQRAHDTNFDSSLRV